MARIKLIIGALAVVVASFVALSGPAMAQDLNCQDAQGNWISCDGTYYAPVDPYGNGYGYWDPYSSGYWDPYSSGYWGPAYGNGYWGGASCGWGDQDVAQQALDVVLC